jgi:hypothetical protein
MAKTTRKLQKCVHHRRDGSVWARGQMTADSVMAAYWASQGRHADAVGIF